MAGLESTQHFQEEGKLYTSGFLVFLIELPM